jgi:GNAT superfamily N-acetyltransferase
MTILTYQRLSPTSQTDIDTMQSVLGQAPSYYLTVEGQSPGYDTARKELLELPHGKTLADKHSFLIVRGVEAVGVIDLIVNYPSEQVAFLGLFLFAELDQGRGYGAEALGFVKALVSDWECSRLRIAVITTNERALEFWQREGFSEIERKPNSRFTDKGDASIFLPHMAHSRASHT